MSILSWLKAVTGEHATADLNEARPMVFAAGEEEFRGLNMKDALDAHASWYHRLEEKINGKSSEELSVALIACDDRCKLGHWIYHEGKTHFGPLSEYEELRRVHADFHLTAGAVLNNTLNGEEGLAREGLRKVRHKSGGVQLALVRLYSSTRG